jgi:hypothetical protein
MMQPTPMGRTESSMHVLLRFGLRVILLIAFACLGSQGFGAALIALFSLAAIFCLTAAIMRRETLSWSALNYWDEAAMYAIAVGLLRRLA